MVGVEELLEVNFQQLPRSFIQFRFGAGTLVGGQRPPHTLGRHVTLEREDPHTEGASGLGSQPSWACPSREP